VVRAVCLAVVVTDLDVVVGLQRKRHTTEQEAAAQQSKATRWKAAAQ
jgi:hypothetical protein